MSELMSRLGGQDLAWYPQVAMVIFLGVFFAVTVRVWLKGRGPAQRAEYGRAASLPLENDSQHTIKITESSR